jgi:hypothetical protein
LHQDGHVPFWSMLALNVLIRALEFKLVCCAVGM